MHKNKLISFILLSGLLAGCSHTLYQAELDVSNSDSVMQKAVLYWSKTDKLLGTSKAGPIILLTACSTRRIDFVDADQGIVFWGVLGGDRRMGKPAAIIKKTVCGRIANATRITDLTAGPLVVNIYCEAVSSDFSMTEGPYTPAYIKASASAYNFMVTEDASWSLFGASISAPAAPVCR